MIWLEHRISIDFERAKLLLKKKNNIGISVRFKNTSGMPVFYVLIQLYPTADGGKFII